jgi:HlyD family secretion protein
MSDKREFRRSIAPEQIDQLMVVVDRKRWIALLTLLALLCVIIAWAIFGSIPIKVMGRGIALGREGVFSITTGTGGWISYLHPGPEVKRGDLLVAISDPKRQALLVSTEEDVVKMREEHRLFESQLQEEEEVKKEQLQSQIGATEFSLQRIAGKVPALQRDLEAKNRLYKDGLLPLATVERARQELIESEIRLEDLRAKLTGLRGELETADYHRMQEFRDRAHALAQEEEKLDGLKIEEQLSTLYAPADGVMLEVLQAEGDRVEPGATLIWMEYLRPEMGPPIFYNYVPVEAGTRIRPGMEAHLDIATVSRQEEGTVVGRVVSVSQFAVSLAEVMSTVRNRELANYLTDDGSAVVQVIVEPELNPESPSGVVWTSGLGPDIQITTGTVCVFEAIVEERRPISYLIPIWKFGRK